MIDGVNQLDHVYGPSTHQRAVLDQSVATSSDPAAALVSILTQLAEIDPAIAIAYAQNNPLVTQHQMEIDNRAACQRIKPRLVEPHRNAGANTDGPRHRRAKQVRSGRSC